MNEKISIVIVNFNNLTDTSDCLNALFSNNRSLRLNCQVIVVDNGSNEELETRLKLSYPEVLTLVLPHNLGFAGGSNAGILYALRNKADYVFLLNNDAFVNDNTIERLLDVFKKDQSIGVVGATILCYDNPRIIDNMGAKVNFFTGNSNFFAHGDIYDEKPGEIDVDYTCGAAMMIKKEVFFNIGLLPKYYFLYGEEEDFCVRAKRKGYRVVVTSEATVLHRASSTVNKYRGLKNYYFHRNRHIFLRLYGSKIQYLFAVFYSAFVIFPYYFFKYIIRGRSNLHDGKIELFSFVRGVLDGLRVKTGYTKSIDP